MFDFKNLCLKLFVPYLGGKKIGEDKRGNTYWVWGKRRMVLYHRASDPSEVPAGWHGWLHKTLSEPILEEARLSSSPNLTGTPRAFRPYPKKIPLYEPWLPKD